MIYFSRSSIAENINNLRCALSFKGAMKIFFILNYSNTTRARFQRKSNTLSLYFTLATPTNPPLSAVTQAKRRIASNPLSLISHLKVGTNSIFEYEGRVKRSLAAERGGD